MRMSASRFTLGLLTVASVVAFGSGTSRALPRFPMEIAADLSGAPLPACSVCHWEGKTGGITTITPFVLALKEHGFEGESQASLASALSQLDSDGIDSDSDGVTDVDELRAGTDPNSPVPQAKTADPSYGCALVGSSSLAWSPWAVFALIGFRGRRRRRD